MRGRNLGPARVHQTVTGVLSSLTAEALKKGKELPVTPPWFTTIGSLPPGEILTRTQPIGYTEPSRRSKNRNKKPSKLFKPLPLSYEEDTLRKQFYTDHPWELARPVVVLENDGRDREVLDWGKGIQQQGRPTNGERYDLPS